MKVGEFIKKIEKYSDFELDVRIVETIPEEELKKMSYPFPYNYNEAKMEIVDIGHSDKVVKINVEELR